MTAATDARNIAKRLEKDWATAYRIAAISLLRKLADENDELAKSALDLLAAMGKDAGNYPLAAARLMGVIVGAKS